MDIIEFSILCKYAPFPYQVDFLGDFSDRVIYVSGRQLGKTTMTAVKTLYCAITEPDKTVLIVASSERQANLLFSKIKEILLIKRPAIGKMLTRETATELHFSNNSKIICLPSGHDGKTVRGYSADITCFDEGAYIPDEVYFALEPSILAKNGKLWLLGTPAGKKGRFWEAWSSEDYHKYHNSSYENPMINPKSLEYEKMSKPEMVFKQEILGEFIEEHDALYPMAIIQPALIRETPPNSGENEYYLGVDLARMGRDETAYVIIRYDIKHDFCIMEDYETTSKKPLTDGMGRVQALHEKYKFEQIYIDETGLGAGVGDYLKENYMPVTAITFTQPEREKIYMGLKNMLEKKKLYLPNDRKLITQLQSLSYDYSSTGKLMVKKSEYGHEDIVDGLSLALYGKHNEKRVDVVNLGF